MARRGAAVVAGLLLALLGWLARGRTPPPLPRGGPPAAPPRRLLVVKLADIGDALGVEPALAALRTAYPAATLEALVTPGARAALGTCPHLDGIVDFEKALFDHPAALLRPRALLAALRLVLTLRRRRYAAVVILHRLSTAWGAAKFALVARATGSPVVAGLDNGRGGFLTHAAVDRGFGEGPEWRAWLAVVATLGIPAPAREPVFTIPPEATRAAERLLDEVAPRSRLLVALHPGVGGYAPLKQWPPARFAAVGRDLIARPGATVLVVGGPDATALGADLAAAIGPGARDLTGRTDLPLLAAVLARCALLIGNDSGVAHLAAAVGCPPLVVFGPTNAVAWAPGGATPLTLSRFGPPDRLPPVNPRGVALRVDEPCSPCYYTGHTVRARGLCLHRNCLHHLQPAAAVAVARAMLPAG
jgi:ADP-heptose:LPS heptosyltransferase